MKLNKLNFSLLSGLFFLSCIPIYAIENIESINDYTYTITIPKTIRLDETTKTSNYYIKIEGNIPKYKEIFITPIDEILETDGINFYMQDLSLVNPKESVLATIIQTKSIWSSQDILNNIEVNDNFISATDLTAGEWKGSFNFKIESKISETFDYIPFTLTSNNYYQLGLNSLQGDIILPEIFEYNQQIYKLTKIDNHTFLNCHSLTSIQIPESVTIIGENSFENCVNLKEIIIPSNVTTIGKYAFRNCSRLEKISIIGNISEIKEGLFTSCASLKEINLPDSLTHLEKYSFQNCTSLTDITLPENLQIIDEGVFQNCSSLNELIVPNNVSYIHQNAFLNLNHITYNGNYWTNAPWGARNIN